MAQTPEETSLEMSRAVTDGDVDAALALFEPDACFARLGWVAQGTEEIRRALDEFVELRASLRGQPTKVLRAGDIALVFGTWSLRGTGPDGNPVELGGRYTDVVRRQADGRWLFVIDNPWGLD